MIKDNINESKNSNQLVKKRKEIVITEKTRKKITNVMDKAYVLMKLGILICAWILCMRQPLIIRAAILPVISLFSKVFVVIAVILIVLWLLSVIF